MKQIMKQFSMVAIVSLLCFTAFAQQKQNLKVLYVGGSTDFDVIVTPHTPEEMSQGVAERTAAFEEYLNRYFTDVTILNGADYKPEMSAGYDVTIFDGKTPALAPDKYIIGANGRSIECHYYPRLLPDDFSYPAILLADMGEMFGRTLGTKTDWYCLCLDADAHHFNAEHPIFKGPYRTELTIEEKPTPEAALHYSYYSDEKLPATTMMWKVQTNRERIGMVARPWGFTDSPDAEVISSGVCAKTIDAVAIGRHGNFFFWGFSSSPRYMTDEAKVVFANAVVYTAGLKGQKMIARKYYDATATKDYMKENIYLTSKETYDENIRSSEESNAQYRKMQDEIKERKNSGETISKDEESLLKYDFTDRPAEPFDKYLSSYMKEAYFEKFGTDTDAYHKFLLDNEPYLYGGGMFYELIVDEDAKSLKTANTDVKLLDKAISLWEKNAGKTSSKASGAVARARRILDRYTLCTFENPQEWRDWYESVKDKLFFTQSGGWYFMVNTLDSSVPGNDYAAKGLYTAKKSIVLPETSDSAPVAAGATLAALPGGTQYVVVKIKVEPGYHIYGHVSESDPFIAEKITLELPDGYTQGDDYKLPAATPYNSTGTTKYTGENTFLFPIEGSGKGIIKVNVTYQCCDSHVCLAPETKVIECKTVFTNR